ncbi:LacI family DNA-binding transcriptional regulator [Microbacterium sp.]|uniref:LacI family DNA-binding transcriptional regulator n=1 Tax=Microbacterium sp. TaxID=51671 RepID=UPI00289A1D50|nr:LacI family DNA-binding transcriptional regulator [Microbacterium sp.]
MVGSSRKGPTIRDIARVSGVSATTVSFVLNDTAGQTIPTDTRERVRSAAQELGYPTTLARAFREGATRTVVVAVGGLPRGTALDSFLDGLEAELSSRDHSVAVLRATGPALTRTIDAISPRAVIDLGAIYAGAESDGLDGGWIDGLASHTLTQVSHLASLGHSRIAFARPADPGRISAMVGLRERHLRESARTLGIDPPAIVALPDETEAGADSLAAAISGGVTAVAGFDDDSAARVLHAARRLGLRVPHDLSVVGFDDAGWGQHTAPALTTVRIEAVDYGRRAACGILGITDQDASAPRSHVVDRGSTGTAPQSTT